MEDDYTGEELAGALVGVWSPFGSCSSGNIHLTRLDFGAKVPRPLKTVKYQSQVGSLPAQLDTDNK